MCCLKYINGYLTSHFKLQKDTKPKPVMGVDDLLLGLTHHWARDASVFPTEDDRLDLPTIMLFQAYTACRPAELVDATRIRGTRDPLLDDKREQHQGDEVDTGPLIEPDLESDQSEDEDMLDADDCHSDDESDTDCSSDGKDQDDGHSGQSVSGNNIDLPILDDDELVREHKALCYEDIILWVVKDPKSKGRDVLAMEVYFRYHKGADNKPKPSVSSTPVHQASN